MKCSLLVSSPPSFQAKFISRSHCSSERNHRSCKPSCSESHASANRSSGNRKRLPPLVQAWAFPEEQVCANSMCHLPPCRSLQCNPFHTTGAEEIGAATALAWETSQARRAFSS